MRLNYLEFDFSDEESGRGSFDAMASVVPGRLPALLGEISAVRAWAIRTFGPAGALEDAGEWDDEVQAVAEPDQPLQVDCDERTGEVSLPPAAAQAERITITFTLSGSRAFCEAFRDAFGVMD
jgi:hypothetical protein